MKVRDEKRRAEVSSAISAAKLKKRMPLESMCLSSRGLLKRALLMYLHTSPHFSVKELQI